MSLATIQTIEEILPHNNADRLELVRTSGYWCVVAKGDYQVGDPCVFISPDTVLPIAPWSEFYRKFSKNRVKAQKIRDVWSFGIVEKPEKLGLTNYQIGDSVAELLGVTKYSPPLPSNLEVRASSLPHGMVRTDQSLWQEVRKIPYGEMADWTLKIDGESCSFYYARARTEGDSPSFGVLSRNQDLKLDAENSYIRNWKRLHVLEKLSKFCEEHRVSLSLQGESYGGGIQKHGNNPSAKHPESWAMYSVWNIDEMRHYRRGEDFYFSNLGERLGLPTVPILETSPITKERISHYDSEISELNGSPFEGVVVNHSGGSFKIINKPYDCRK